MSKTKLPTTVIDLIVHGNKNTLNYNKTIQYWMSLGVNTDQAIWEHFHPKISLRVNSNRKYKGKNVEQVFVSDTSLLKNVKRITINWHAKIDDISCYQETFLCFGWMKSNLLSRNNYSCLKTRKKYQFSDSQILNIHTIVLDSFSPFHNVDK